MAEIQQNDGGGKGKNHQKKMTIRVDFTPMVDMNMLLITFFMLCTTMIKSQTLSLSLPTNEKQDNVENMNQASSDDAVTIIVDAKRKPNSEEVDSLNGKVVTEVYYYFGKPGGDGGIEGPGGTINSENNNLQRTELLTDEVNNLGDHKARGIREIIQQRNQEVYSAIQELKKKYNDGEFGSLETDADRKQAQEKYKEAAAKVLSNESYKKPVIIIKSTPQASYGALVSILDEMQINSITRYQIDNITRQDSLLLKDFMSRNGGN